LIAASHPKPQIVCLNETFLDTDTAWVHFEGWEVVSRRDRPRGSSKRGTFGGVMILASTEIAHRVVELRQSEISGRVWAAIHSRTGPILLCCWYLPPKGRAPEEAIAAWGTEYDELTANGGFMGLHHLG
jgi:hypothetical protein